MTHVLRSTVLAVSLLAAVAPAQAVSPAEEGILQRVLRAARDREQVLTQFHVRGSARFDVQREKPLSPPKVIDFTAAFKERRAFVSSRGGDIVRLLEDEGRNAHLEQLFHPSGSRESYFPRIGKFSYTEVTEGDPRFTYDELLPNEHVLSFCSTPRTRILTERPFTVAWVKGVTPLRTARIRGPSRDGTQWMEFDLREDWDWLPIASRAQIDVGGELTTYYSTEVHSVHETRLGFFPAQARACFLDPTSAKVGGELECVTRVRLEFDAIRFDDVSVPATLNPEFRGGESIVPGDTLYSETSFISSSRLAGRDAEIARLTSVAAAQRSPGAPSWSWRVWMLGLIGIALLSAFGLFARRARRPILRVVALLAVIVPAVRFSPGLFASDKDICLAEMGDEFKSSYLCGPDALCAATKLTVTDRVPHYLEILRLVRPGKAGVSLERLRIAWSCTGTDVDLVRSESFARPPCPSLWHVKSGHFVTVLSESEAGVCVFDPSRGVYQTSWEGLGRTLSGPGLVPAGE